MRAPQMTYTQYQGPANVFIKGPDDKYLQLPGLEVHILATHLCK